MTINDPSLTHKDRTVQDLLDELSPEEKDLQALIVGAALEGDDLSGDDKTVAAYDSLSLTKKYLIDFMVGNTLAEEALKHSEPELDNFLAHVGVKGMKWGVRKADSTGTPRLSKSRLNNPLDRREAREKVKTGSGTLADSHLAALKSTGHRAINAFTGDKRFWRNMAITAGVTGVAVGAAVAAPALMPAGALVSIGAGAMNATGAAFGISGMAAGISSAELASLGAGIVTGTGLQVASAGAVVGVASNAVTNTVRAVRGNAKINRSYSELGKNVLNRQTEGSRATQKVLNRSGSLGKKKVTPAKPELKQSDLRVGDFLAHHANTPVKLVKQDI